jgi:glycerol-1-phosphate dehydrogenase [NAD(P)+]
LEEPIEGCACGRDHPVGLERVLVGAGALDEVTSLLPAPSRLDGPVLLLADPNTYDAAGMAVSRRLRLAGHRVIEAIAGRRSGSGSLGCALRADDEALESLASALDCRPAKLVAVGSGTINDLGKALSEDTGVGLVTVGTAASMNGYASSIVALTIGGLKVTRAAASAEALLFDTNVLAAAPPRLNRAGFGDLVSKPVSGADWVLSSWLFGEDLCPTALSMADEAVARARRRAEGIGRGDAEALVALVEALVLSGLSMTIAGASSPASGGEHLISHYLDISGEEVGGENVHLHGEKVAVGTLASLELYRRLREAGPPPKSGKGPPEESAEEIASRHGRLSPAAREALVAQALAKASRAPRRKERRRIVAARWKEMWEVIDPQLAGSARLEQDLVKAGVPHTFAGIGIDRERAAELIRLARHMRNRYTVLDLAADLGRLDGWSGEIAAGLAG